MMTNLPTASLMKLLLVLALLLGTASVGTSAPAYEDPLAEIIAILINDSPATGPITTEQVEIRRAGGQIEPGSIGMKLYARDEVKTGAGAQVNVAFTRPDSDDRIEVQIHEGSKAKISSVFFYTGGYFFSGWGWDLFDTKTSYVRLGKRGTEFQLRVNEQGDVDLKVLRGEVEVEKGEFSPDAGNGVGTKMFGRNQRWSAAVFRHAPRRRPRVDAKLVKALEAIEIKRSEALPQPSPLSVDEAVSIVNKTDKLMLASLPAAAPKNIVITSIVIPESSDSDPATTGARLREEFVAARRKAIFEPTVANTIALGNVYKDLGAGKRAVGEYREAEKKESSLLNDAKFLAAQAEAYRLSGNLRIATLKAEEAVRKSKTAAALTGQLALIALGNVAYDKAVASIARKESAADFFLASQTAFEEAKSKQDDFAKRLIEYNLENVKVALKSDPSTPLTLSGTFRGIINFPAGGLRGSSVLVLTGRRLTFMTCDKSVQGSILAARTTPEGQEFDLIFDSKTYTMRFTLRGNLIGDQITLLSPEINFSFRTVPNQPALKCIDMSMIK